jgi:hypothetical protein
VGEGGVHEVLKTIGDHWIPPICRW